MAKRRSPEGRTSGPVFDSKNRRSVGFDPFGQPDRWVAREEAETLDSLRVCMVDWISNETSWPRSMARSVVYGDARENIRRRAASALFNGWQAAFGDTWEPPVELFAFVCRVSPKGGTRCAA
jgi:hypothetical protein